jgi:hypothetical protein
VTEYLQNAKEEEKEGEKQILTGPLHNDLYSAYARALTLETKNVMLLLETPQSARVLAVQLLQPLGMGTRVKEREFVGKFPTLRRRRCLSHPGLPGIRGVNLGCVWSGCMSVLVTSVVCTCIYTYMSCGCGGGNPGHVCVHVCVCVCV